MKRTCVLLAALTGLIVTLAACGSSGSSSKTTPATAPAGGASTPAATGSATFPAGTGSITIGSADFPESELLMDIYGDAMAAKGVKVTKKANIGERSVYIAALKDGSIDFVPEYSGSILDYLDTAATAKTSAEVYAALQAKVGSTLVVLKFAAAQDSDTITVTKDTATKYSLKSIGDLSPVASKLTLGAPSAVPDPGGRRARAQECLQRGVR